jgi:hypothetical protein
MKKILSIGVVGIIIVGAVSFYGGMKYAQARRGTFGNFNNLTADQRQQFMQRDGTGTIRTGSGGGMMRGFIGGEILSKDDKSITIKMQDGGSKIVFYSDKTEIGMFTTGTLSDVTAGKNVSVNGTTNPDGSMTAQSIQIRPVLPTPTPNK